MAGRVKNKSIFIALFFLVLLSSLSCYAGAKEDLDEETQLEREQEMARIEKFKKNVRRDGDTLYLKTESGENLVFKDTQECDPLLWCSYEFMDYYKDSGFYVILVSTIELLDYMMISEKDGKEYLVMEPPIISPDSKRIVSATADEFMNPNGVFIWRFQDGKLIAELSYKPSFEGLHAGYYYFKRWKDNKTIEVYKQFITTEKLCPDSDHVEIELTFKLEDEAWNVSEKPVNCNSKWR